MNGISRNQKIFFSGVSWNTSPLWNTIEKLYSKFHPNMTSGKWRIHVPKSCWRKRRKKYTLQKWRLSNSHKSRSKGNFEILCMAIYSSGWIYFGNWLKNMTGSNDSLQFVMRYNFKPLFPSNFSSLQKSNIFSALFTCIYSLWINSISSIFYRDQYWRYFLK